MSHNPEKNKAVCVLAKTAYYSMVAMGWIAVAIVVVVFGASAFLAARSADWATLPARAWANCIKPMFILLLVCGTMVAIGAGANWIFERVKRYAKDC